MTNQEAFETMVRHLRRQGCQSVSEDGIRCLYRGPNGRMCAVGALISDGEYQGRWDAKGMRVEHLDLPWLGDLDMRLLEFMQFTHDHVTPSRWEKRFMEVAGIFNLTLPPLGEASHA